MSISHNATNNEFADHEPTYEDINMGVGEGLKELDNVEAEQQAINDIQDEFIELDELDTENSETEETDIEKEAEELLDEFEDYEEESDDADDTENESPDVFEEVSQENDVLNEIDEQSEEETNNDTTHTNEYETAEEHDIDLNNTTDPIDGSKRLDADERVAFIESLAEKHGEEPVNDVLTRFERRKDSSGMFQGAVSENQAIGNLALESDNPLRDEEEADGFEPTEEQANVYEEMVALSEEFEENNLENEDGEAPIHRGLNYRTSQISAAFVDNPEAEEIDMPEEEHSIAYTPNESKAKDFTDSANMLHTDDATENDTLGIDAIGTKYEPHPDFNLTHNVHEIGEEDHANLPFQKEGEHLVIGKESIETDDLWFSNKLVDKNPAEIVQSTTENPEEADVEEHDVMASMVKQMASDGVAPESEEGVEHLKKWGEHIAEDEIEDGGWKQTSNRDKVENVNDVIGASDHEIEPVEWESTEDNDEDELTLIDKANNPEVADQEDHEEIAKTAEFLANSDKDIDDEEKHEAFKSWGEYVDETPYADHGVVDSYVEDVNEVLKDSEEHGLIGETEETSENTSDSHEATEDTSLVENIEIEGDEETHDSESSSTEGGMSIGHEPQQVNIDHDDTGGLEDTANLEGYTPEDIEATDGMGKLGGDFGNTIEAKEVVEFEDGTTAVHTDTNHPDADEDLGRRAVTAATFTRELHDDYEDHGVPETKGDPDEGYFFTAPAPGDDAHKAPQESTDEIEPDQFYRQAANQVLMGNNDAHATNVKVDEDGGLHWFDQDHSAGEIDDPSAHNKDWEYENNWERMHGELGKAGESMGLGSQEEVAENIKERVQEEAEKLDRDEVEEARDKAAEHDEEFAENIFQNIMQIKNGNIPE